MSTPAPPPRKKNGRAPSRHCRDASAYDDTTTAMHDMSNPLTPPLDCCALRGAAGALAAVLSLVTRAAEILEIVGMGGIIELGCIMGFNNAGVRAQRLCQVCGVGWCCLVWRCMVRSGAVWCEVVLCAVLCCAVALRGVALV